jgi:hypothetical protein
MRGNRKKEKDGNKERQKTARNDDTADYKRLSKTLALQTITQKKESHFKLAKRAWKESVDGRGSRGTRKTKEKMEWMS